MHGPNLWPAALPGLRAAVTAYMDAATRAAGLLMEGVSLSLGLDADWFARTYTAEPTVLFRIFHYPAGGEPDAWGVGEHTDYGLLTLLAQDRFGGLQVKTPGGWIEAPPIEGALVCNIGDMLERLTGGRYRSTPHRVRNTSGHDRLSFPLFFDPDFTAAIEPLPQHATIGADAIADDRARPAASRRSNRADISMTGRRSIPDDPIARLARPIMLKAHKPTISAAY
jgi:isopenicillin N synthase-like dioxygenase